MNVRILLSKFIRVVSEHENIKLVISSLKFEENCSNHRVNMFSLLLKYKFTNYLAFQDFNDPIILNL